MRIAVIGTGHVGLVAGTGFADNGHQVVCVDKDASRIEMLREGKLPIYEPGLEELVMRNIEEERLSFSTDTRTAVASSLIVFLCVGTPEGPGGRPDVSHVLDAAGEIGDALNDYKVIVSKSTCPVGTVERIADTIRARTPHRFDIVANPEFMKEGAAIDDFMRPDRVVVGCDDVRVLEIMKELYAPFLRSGKPFLAMDVRSAELSKYAVSAMLGARIALINEIAHIAGAHGADIDLIRQAMMADRRIGPDYLYPGLGFGGSCLPKDVAALSEMAREAGLPRGVIDGTGAANHAHLRAFGDRILGHYGDSLSSKRLAVWGGSFKSKTDDIRSAPAVGLIDRFLEAGAEVRAYDPEAGTNLRAHYGDRLTVVSRVYAAAEQADGLVIATEWREFHNPDFERLGTLMRGKAIFDGRNLYNPATVRRHGFFYLGIGREGK